MIGDTASGSTVSGPLEVLPLLVPFRPRLTCARRVCRAVEAMQGSTVEAMADALDGAFCVCFGISKECKSVDAFSI